MIQRVAKIKDMKDNDSIADDLKFWLSKSPEERVAAVDYLKRQYDGSTARLQRVVRVVQRLQS